ncbi:MAG: hypothetical protein EH224_08365 [Calditrichaeota bacterium]|nr:MAG: hypothetical protein EH224_08365 [Calditrichota bacterium]
MGYYLRYISDDDRDININLLENALRAIDQRYIITKENPTSNVGDLVYGDELFGIIEVNTIGEDIFEEEIEELKENINDINSKNTVTVRQTLTNARTIIAIQVLFQGRSIEQTLCKIDPLWNWLFGNRKGLLQVDGEGYYEKSGLILEEP